MRSFFITLLALFMAFNAVSARPTLKKARDFVLGTSSAASSLERRDAVKACEPIRDDCLAGAYQTESCCVARLVAAGNSGDKSCYNAFQTNTANCHTASNYCGTSQANCQTSSCCIPIFAKYTKTTTAAAILEHSTCTPATDAQLLAYRKLFGQNNPVL